MKKIDVSGWKKFKIEDVFMIKKPDVRSEKYYEEGTVNYVSSGAFNNGVMKCLKPKEGEVLDKGHCITVSPLDGSSFWQENDFLGRGGSGASIALLYNDNLNQLNALFICSVIKKSAGKYGYANLLNGNNLKNLEVILPAITKYIPDFNTLTREVSGGGINMNKIDTSSWKEFEISELFDIHPTKNLGLTNHELFSTTGNTPVVVNSSCNNGIGGYVDLPATEDGGIITFSDTTDANSIFYQKENFIGYSHVQGMYPKFDNNSDEIIQYIMTVFKAKALTKGYNYSNKFRRDDALKTKILLPAKTINEPDWQFMENYIKELTTKTSKNINLLLKVS